MTKTLALIAKTTITLALLYFSVSRAGLGLIAEHAEQLNPGWFLASVAVLSLQTLISAVRWRGIIRDCGATISLAQAARWTFIIGMDGKIVYKNVNVKPDLDSKQVGAFIKDLKKS